MWIDLAILGSKLWKLLHIYLKIHINLNVQIYVLIPSE